MYESRMVYIGLLNPDHSCCGCIGQQQLLVFPWLLK